jgi:hypothetical protein
VILPLSASWEDHRCEPLHLNVFSYFKWKHSFLLILTLLRRFSMLTLCVISLKIF